MPKPRPTTRVADAQLRAIMGATLTKRQREILTKMRDLREHEGGELVYERGIGYLGLERVSARTVFTLLRCCAISALHFNAEPLERYRINETGTKLLGKGK